MLRLEKSRLRGFWELKEDGRDAAFDGTIISGTRAEWLAIAAAIETKCDQSFRRCAVYFAGHYFTFSCPRNGYGQDSHATLFDNEAADFLAHVRQIFPAGTYDSDEGMIGLAQIERECWCAL